MGKQSLVALDTDHIKGYVFGTDKLREIRGASSVLDSLNRREMRNVAREVDPSARLVYTNGGSGLFLLDSDKAHKFGQAVQSAYRRVSHEGASLTYAVQVIPKTVKDPWNDDIWDTLELMRYRLLEKKGCLLDDYIALPSHPFMRLCDACGREYAERKYPADDQDPDDEKKRFCEVCYTKREENKQVKERVKRIIKARQRLLAEQNQHVQQAKSVARRSEEQMLIWERVMRLLPPEYDIPDTTERPRDFNIFRNFKGTKEYFGLIYSDANNMGKKIRACRSLAELHQFAGTVDKAVYQAVCDAITEHLKIEEHLKPRDQWTSDLTTPVFPFDILLLGGDDVVMVTPATVALDVARTIAQKFHEKTAKKHTLSVGVVLAPVKYPFGLLLELAEETLKAAKKAGTQVQTTGQNIHGDTRINFMVVTGGTSQSFKKVYASLHSKRTAGDREEEFYATLRPYTPERLEILLKAIRKGHALDLGRTKLHQLREAVLKMNRTTSVVDGLALLRSWNEEQREYIVKHLHQFWGLYQPKQQPDRNLVPSLLHIPFPWFADGAYNYRTSLLDFVELYDFLIKEEAENSAK